MSCPSVFARRPLEQDLQRELQLSGEVLLGRSDGPISGHGAGCAGKDARNRERVVADWIRVWTSEDRSVGYVESFGFELQIQSFLEFELFSESQC